MSKGRSRRRVSSKAGQEDLRQILNRRRQASAVQIRKQRKEELLRRKRGIQTEENTTHRVSLSNAVEAYLRTPVPEHLCALFGALSSSSSSEFWQQLIKDDPRQAQTLVFHLSRHIRDRNEAIQQQALSIFLDMSSVPSPKSDAEGYYTKAPLRWSDIFCDEQGLISSLIGLLLLPNTVHIVSNILGNLVLDSSRALSMILPSWPQLVQALPATSYVCATIVKEDATSYASDFLQKLTPNHITQLLQDDKAATDAAWILEGLSRREETAVDHLCNDSRLIDVFVQSLHNATVGTQTVFLVPALQAVGNMALAGQGRQVGMLMTQSLLVESLAQLLEQKIVIDVVSTAGCFLCDSGIPSHPSTEIAVPAFVSGLLTIVTSDQTSLDWKREAVYAISVAVEQPYGPTNPEVDSSLERILREHVWVPATRDSVMQSLLDLLNCPDADAVLATLHILDRSLRMMPDLRFLLESQAGVNQLEQVCQRAVGEHSEDLEMASNIAANLLDDFFDQEHEEDDEEEKISPGVDNNQFVFGAAASEREAFDFVASNAGRGRGRGQTLPAWMTQSKS